MLSSGSGAFGVSSAISQPPGFTDSPEGTSPDQGRRKRRAKGRGLLKASLAPPRARRAAAVSTAGAVFVRSDDQTGGGLDLRHRGHVAPGAEPTPALAWRG